MKVGIISDIHGNWEALREVVKFGEKSSVEKWWCLGDIVGYYPQPVECIEWVSENCEICVMGNHDSAVTDEKTLSFFNPVAREALLFTRKLLKEEHLEFLASLPLVVEKEDIVLSHSNPFYPELWTYIFDAFDVFCLFSLKKPKELKKIYLIGHTHIPAIFSYDGGKVKEERFPLIIKENVAYLLNPGSVGQPRDGVNSSSFLILDLEKLEFILHRINYDFKIVQKLVIESGLPKFLADRLEKGI
ncbi:MAG: metallophosphoesterase family protein [Thermosulfidibacteraceae bacterium]|jgi:predicted phosphodiesterase